MTTANLMESLPELARRIDLAKHVVVGLDFDGTLAPLQSQPDAVTLPEPVRTVLSRLASLPRVTPMIVSGRRLTDVAARVGLANLIYAGNHGLEIRGPGLNFVEPTAAATEQRLHKVTENLRRRLSAVPGFLVEAKGLTTSVHYRNVQPEHRDELASAVREAVDADTTKLVLFTGHAIWEIRPRVSWHKGDAVVWTMQQLGIAASSLAFFLGDDRTDEDAFAALPDGITVKVGSPGTPTEARYWLPDPDAVCAFLVWLEEQLAR
jgi:trehalose 6-phosphate phosphatase